MEARLDGQRFVRIHRSRIVNTDRIKELQPWFNGEYVVVLQNGTYIETLTVLDFARMAAEFER